MSIDGLCLSNVCPSMVYVQIIHVRKWYGFNLIIHMFINEALMNSCLLNGEIILK